MSRNLKELEGMDKEIGDLFDAACEGIDFTSDWAEIRDLAFQAAEACHEKYNSWVSSKPSDVKTPPVRAYHFNTTDRRMYLAYDLVKKEQSASEARRMFETGSFVSPDDQKKKLEKLLKQAAELQAQLGSAGEGVDLSSILANLAG